MPDPMAPERLAEIRERAEVLTRAIDAEFTKEHDAPYEHGIEYYLGAAVQVTRAVPALLVEVERLRAELAKPKGDEVLDWVAECGKPGHPDWYLHSENWPYDKRDCPTCAVEAAETERDRIRTAWDSARRGRRSARLLNRELIASMDVLHGRLQRYMDDKNTAAAHFTNQYSRMHLERDQMRTERDAAREQAERVRALHYEVCSGACGLDDACECGPRDLVCAECNDRCPCPTVRALGGTEPGQ